MYSIHFHLQTAHLPPLPPPLPPPPPPKPFNLQYFGKEQSFSRNAPLPPQPFSLTAPRDESYNKCTLLHITVSPSPRFTLTNSQLSELYRLRARAHFAMSVIVCANIRSMCIYSCLKCNRLHLLNDPKSTKQQFNLLRYTIICPIFRQ